MIDLGGPEVAGVDLDILLPVQVELLEHQGQEVLDGDGHARGHHVVIGPLLLEHPPHGLDIVPGEAPVTLGLGVAQEELVLQAQLDAGGGPGDLAGDEGLTASGALVVEEDAVGHEHAVALAVVHALVVGIDLGAGVRAARLEAGALVLAGLGGAKHLGAASLVEAHLVPGGVLVGPHGLQQAQHAKAHDIRRELRLVEAHPNVALGSQVIDLGGLDLVQEAAQGPPIREVAVVEVQLRGLVGVDVEVIDAVGVEVGSPADDAVDFVALGEQQFSEVAAVLAGDAGDEGDFRVGQAAPVERECGFGQEVRIMAWGPGSDSGPAGSEVA